MFIEMMACVKFTPFPVHSIPGRLGGEPPDDRASGVLRTRIAASDQLCEFFAQMKKLSDTRVAGSQTVEEP
jgi:hypothetical protein